MEIPLDIPHRLVADRNTVSEMFGGNPGPVVLIDRRDQIAINRKRGFFRRVGKIIVIPLPALAK